MTEFNAEKYIENAHVRVQVQQALQQFIQEPLYPVHIELLRELSDILARLLKDPKNPLMWAILNSRSGQFYEVANAYEKQVAEQKLKEEENEQ